MIYALNLFNLIPGRENEYRDYSVKAGKIIFGLGGRVASAGIGPLRENSTTDYIWTLYQPWDMRQWVRQAE